MPGRLYRVCGYPGMRPPCVSGEMVTGELYRLRQPAKTLEVLDEYEENYRRELLRATLANGRTRQCWVYMYRFPVLERRRVASGEWNPAAG